MIRTFVDPEAVLLQPAPDLAAGAERDADGWSRATHVQRWFDHEVKARYNFDPTGRLQSIDLSAPDAATLLREMRIDLGAPDKEGPSPQFLNSMTYARWVRGTVTFVLEDYAPGCEIAIIPTR